MQIKAHNGRGVELPDTHTKTQGSNISAITNGLLGWSRTYTTPPLPEPRMHLAPRW